ncbi:MAG TPA: PP2C family protein-serine/threonine phosphatase [Acidimicrobiales bacterium]|nr:PP2C family protein-serine/threonine phosphatase [Acidimicrobiales bacterium]
MAETRPAAGNALATLLELSHYLAPHALGTTVRDVVAEAGFANATIYVVDYEQRSMRALPPGDASLDIDSTMGGRAFRHVEVVTARNEEGDLGRLWVPILDGSERMGVLSVDVEAADPQTVADAGHIASLVGELLVSKLAYGDQLQLLKRTRPMGIPSEMRWALLPPLTFSTKQVAVSGVLEPAYDIAGDAFDYALNGDCMHLAVIDAMGHGLEASRMANLAIGTYRHARRHDYELIDMFRSMDETIASQFGPEKFVTGHLARLDVISGVLRWANAGHPRPLLLRDASVIGELEAETCLPIGLGDVPAEVAETQLEPGDTVLFFTDGVVEARSPDGELFGEWRLVDHLTRAAVSREPLPEMMRRLVHAILAHEGTELRDDATLLAVRWMGAAGSDRPPHASVTTS